MNERKRHLPLPDAPETKVLRQEPAVLNLHQTVQIIVETPAPERVERFRNLSPDMAGAVFQALSPREQDRLFDDIRTRIAAEAPHSGDDSGEPGTQTPRELPGKLVRRLLEQTPDRERDSLFRFLGYPREAIARMMTGEFVALRPEFTTEEALEQIRRYGTRAGSFDLLYVVDNSWRLLRTIGIHDLLLAPPKQTVAALGSDCTLRINARDDRETVAERFRNNGPASLPVVDAAGTLLGVVSLDEIREIEREEATEDFQKFGGSEELGLSYTRTPLSSLVKKRAGWLVVLFLSEMLTASAMGHFDDEIARAVVLALFVPLVISSGGNSGSQAASLIIRALALGELSVRNTWYVLRKEFLSGTLLGLILGAIGLLRIFVWQLCGIYDYGPFWGWVAISVAVSLLFIVLWGTLAGAMIPLLLKRLGLDPATASAPFVATLADVTGLIIYFSVAALFLSGKLL